MFRFYIIIILFSLTINCSFSNTLNKKDYNLLGGSLTVIIDSENDEKQIFKKIKKKLRYIEAILDPEISSFLKKFNELEKNSEISAPDLFVDAFSLMKDYNEITKKAYDPTTFSLLYSVSTIDKVRPMLNSKLFEKCMNISNIDVKITNVFSKRYSCIRLSFDSLIDGIIVQNIKFLLESKNYNSYFIKFGNTVYSRNFHKSSNLFDKKTTNAIKQVGITIRKLDSYSYLVNSNDKIRTYNINLKTNQISLNNDFFVIVASDSPVNNSILSNTLNLVDYTIFSENLYEMGIPILIIFKDNGNYIFKHSKSFEDFLE
ncbi:hypothetical protein HOB96_00515 [bacterium]|jgi:hypothetical protein|nr:hypothetical protein [bacterium]MBT4633915.1 hypothetical protein [bacterium]